MRKIREALRLKTGGFSKRRIAASLGISATAAMECVQRAPRAGLTWPLPEDLSDEALAQRLYPAPTSTKEQRPLPNWAEIQRELKRPGVTLELLWQEYREQHANGYGYSRFCGLNREWQKRLSPTMRQTHIAGEKMFVDYSGTKLQVMDWTTGEVLTAELFVGVLGASSLTYAEATWTQSLPDWIGAHKRALRYFGGVTAMIGTRSFSSVKSILNTKLDRKRPEKAAEGPAIVHDNIRGPTFQRRHAQLVAKPARGRLATG